MTLPKALFITLLILFNAIPVYGVLYWDWQSFDLIFLYWLENLFIGLFTVLRILIRPYRDTLERGASLFMGPFFAIHYGMFCYGHGVFIIHLFGKGLPVELSGLDIPELIIPVIESRHLVWPVLALFAYQLMDWIRDTVEHGLGSESPKKLMTAPYRRIVVLHITILASGFVLTALNEPIMGLFILIGLKTAFDIYHWCKDERQRDKGGLSVLDENSRKNLDVFLDNPTIQVNGETIHFDSYEDLKASKHYGMIQSMLRFGGGSKNLQQMEAYIQQRLDERRSQAKDQD